MPNQFLRILLALLMPSFLLAQTPSQKISLPVSITRHSPSDLELSGLPSLPPTTLRYVAYADLLKLPQVSFAPSPQDENFSAGFTRPTTVTGVRLDVLAAALGIDVATIMPIAFCADGYRANYPSDYISAHHPVLVLAVNGLPPARWPLSHYGDSMSPYIISHDNFVPAFQVLSHQDEMQIPYAVVRIEFRNQQQTFAAIAPPGMYIPESPVFPGYAIAKQNCFRCHNNGDAGGTMAHHPWQVLSAWAAYQPDYFTQYVHSPGSLRKGARMPGNANYDAATLDALRRYFATFYPKVSPAQ